MASYPIPTWLQPADLPSAYAKGLQIGAQIGEQQTRTRLAEAEMLRRNEEAAQEQAYRDAAMALKTQEQMRSAKAQDEYRRLVQSGIEPMEAIKRIGPNLNVDAAFLKAVTPQAAPLPKFAAGRWWNIEPGKAPNPITPEPPQRNVVLGQGSRLVNPMTGETVAEGAPDADVLAAKKLTQERLLLKDQIAAMDREIAALPIGSPAEQGLRTKRESKAKRFYELGLGNEDIGDEIPEPPMQPKPAKSRYTIIEAR